MKVLKERKYLLFALLALLFVFAGCKGESPTAPTPNSGPGGAGGGVTPPTGATITLTVSNATPLVSSTSTITATVALNNSPVPNGTAVEFGASGAGRFQDTGSNVTIRTTTNGVATAVLTAAAAGPVTVTAIVNNVSKQVVVTFQAQQTTPPPPDTTASITSITPTTGRPEGGEVITITGKNFRTPVRVLFDVGNGVLKEALVTSVTATQVQVLTPQVTLGAGQTLDATITLINEAGSPNEQKITAGTPFTYRLAQLTPVFSALSPDNGPIGGGTRVTIFGAGFEAPVQVSFAVGGSGGALGWAQMQVINVTYNQIVAITPTARDVTPDGSGVLTGPVDLRIRNINSGTEIIAPVVFRYTPKMQITAISPNQGTALGGTQVRIDGVGFDDPVSVYIAGVPATVTKVTGTQILATTSGLASPCAASSGPVVVTNVNNGDQASSLIDIGPIAGNFSYIAVKPLIISAVGAGAITPGSSVTVTVQDPGVGFNGTANIRFTVNGANVPTTPSVITTGLGLQTFTIIVPATGFSFPTVTCTTSGGLGGTQLGTVTADIAFNNLTTGCSDVLPAAITVNPPAPNTCLSSPSATVSANPSAGGCAAPAVASVTATGAPRTTQAIITVSNAAGAQPLNITGAAIGGPNASDFSITPTTASAIPAGGSATFTLTFNPAAAGVNKSATVTFATNATTQPAPLCVTATANP